MGRAPCCDDEGLKKGAWSSEEDKKLVDFIQRHGHGSWRGLPKRAGLNRCGKSCRLRWTNYLRPDIKRGAFSEEEERLVIHLHSVLGNKWSQMATHLPGRTDNEIKNHWNTHLRKRLLRNGVDPVTHRPRADLSLLANLSRLLAAASLGNLAGAAPWEDALRVQADAAQLARIQLLQSLLQAMTCNSPSPSLDLAGLMGSAACLQNHQPGGDIMPLPGLLDSSLWSITESTSGLMTGFSIPQRPSDAQLLAQSLALGEGGGGGRLASLDVSSSSDQMSSTCVTAASTPSLASASPLENPTMDPIQDIIYTNDVPAALPAEAFEPCGVLAEADSDYYNWEDMLGHLHLQTWPTAL